MQLLTLFTFPYLHEQTRDEVINFIFWHTNERTSKRRHNLLMVTGCMKRVPSADAPRRRGNSEREAALRWKVVKLHFYENI